MGTVYNSKTAAANAIKAKTHPLEKSTIKQLTLIRSDTPGGGVGVEVSFTCTNTFSKIADTGSFELDIEQYDKNTSSWSQLGNGTTKLDKGSFVTVSGTRYWTYRFDAPDDESITKLRARVRPVSKTHSVTVTYYNEKNNKTELTKTIPYFSFGNGVNAGYCAFVKIDNPAFDDAIHDKPSRPGVPSARLLVNGAIDVSFDPVDPATADTCRILYRCVDGAYTSPGEQIVSHSVIKGSTDHYTDTAVSPGHEYRYYARSHNARNHDGESGTWDDKPSLPADLSDPVATAPLEVENLAASCYGPDSARVTFTYPGYRPAVSQATIYYSDDLETLLTNRESCSSATVSLGTSSLAYIVGGLEAGKEWYFGVFLKTGDDAMCERFCDSVASTLVSTKPEPPTLFPLPKSACTDDELEVEWLHNSADGSTQTGAAVKVSGDGWTREFSPEPESRESLTVALGSISQISDGDRLTVSVKTKGAGGEWSDYSEERAVTVYVRPAASLSITSDATMGGDYGLALKRLPLEVRMSVGAPGVATLKQQAVQWRLAIFAAEEIEYSNLYGDTAYIASGELVAELVYDSGDEGFGSPQMTAQVPATASVFADGAGYRVTASALMDSGLEATPATAEFSCSFDGGLDSPSAYIEMLPTWSASIRAFTYKDRERPESGYIVDSDVLRLAPVEGATQVTVDYTFDGKQAFETYEWDGSEQEILLQFEWDSIDSVSCDAGELEGSAYPDPYIPDNVLVSVYRVGPDGEMAEVAVSQPNGAVVTDRHPSFGSTTYRVVANDQLTDEVTAADIVEDNLWKSVLIQWDEGGVAPDDDLAPIDFEYVELPYNIETRQQSAKDVALKNYAGRPHPVALYGTQVGDTATWTCQFPKREGDLELSQLRKLAAWMGTCWVREPSGLSYPANVDVSITRSYDSAAVDVTLEVTRVDGD